MIRTGIYGGSFNPIHNGHTQLGDFLCQQGFLDELWFMVSPQNPFKQQATDLLNDQARLHLAQLAVRHHLGLFVSDFEFNLPRPSYMVRTLEALRQKHPNRLFYLVIGADNWLAFDRWQQPEEILRHHPLFVYPRIGFPIAASNLPTGVTLVNTPLINISSSELRTAIQNGENASYGLNADVWKEIQRKGYYKTLA